MTRPTRSRAPALARPRHVQAALLLALAALGCGAGLGLLWLDASIGPARQPFHVRWLPGTSALERRSAERTLDLRDSSFVEQRTWAYRLRRPSREAVRRIVVHPLVEDTAHIERGTFRILIDRPDVPAWLRTLLESGLGPALGAAALGSGLVALWFARGALRRYVVALQSIRGFDVALAALALGAGFWLFSDNGHAVDENVHYDQIVRLARGDWSLNPVLTVVPGFHALVAALAWATGGVGEFPVRLIVFGLSLSTIGVFHLLARTLHPEAAGMRTLQFTFLPILFPQFFLIYTDVASLLFVLAMMLAVVRGRPRLAGALGLISCLVRQSNVVWVAFALLFCYLRDQGWTWQRPLRDQFARYWTFVATGAAFLAFVAANGGEVALGDDAASHPLGSLHFTNVFLLLFLSCVLFLPLWWGYAGRFWTPGTLAWTPVPALALLPVFWLGFVNDHPHNTERASYFLTNALLMSAASGTVERLLFFVPVLAAALCSATVPMRTPWRLLYPFTVLFLLPEWLVVPRYYLIPFALFLLARDPAPPWSERLQLALFAAGSVVTFLIVERSWGWF